MTQTPTPDQQADFPQEALRLLAELQVHQIELEMQNAALIEAQGAIEAGQRFTDLYNFSPLAYFSITSDSSIQVLNVASARLLNVELTELKGRFLIDYVEPESLAVFNDFLTRVFALGTIETCEIQLKAKDRAAAITVFIQGITDGRGKIGNLAITDITERRHLENAIRQRDQYKRALLDNIPCLVWLKDEKSHYLAVNDFFAQTFNLSAPDGQLSKSECSRMPPEMIAACQANDRKVIESGIGDSFDKIVEMGGEKRCFEIHKSPVSLDGQVIGTVGYARDITAQRLSDQQLRDSEMRYRALAENSFNWIWVIDLNGKHVYSNDRCCDILDMTLDEFLQADPLAIIHPDDRGLYTSTLQQAIAYKTGWTDVLIRFKKKNGRYRTLESRATPLFDGQGSLVGFQGADRDVTEEKQAEKILKESEEKFRQQSQRLEEVIWGTDSGTWEWNVQSGEMVCNERWAEIIGTTVEELAPFNIDRCNALIHPDDLDKSLALLEQCFNRETDAYDCELRLRHKSGDWIWILDRGRVVEWRPDGTPLRMSGTDQVITTRKNAEAALVMAKAEAVQANQAKSRFLAAASHDLRQPLSALSLYIGMLKKSVIPVEAPLLGNIVSCVDSLNELLTDLLDVSKLDAGVVAPQVQDFAVADLLEKLVSVHAPEARLKGLKLRSARSRLITHTDPVLYKRLLGNLLANAIRYTQNGGVLIGCRRRQGKAWIEVWDSGIGIPEDKTEEIFEEFKQLGHGERNRGSGLGLAIVAKSAALLGLEIRVRSQLGKGSMFAIELPLGKAVITDEEEQLESGQRAVRIGLVDDNKFVLDAMTCALEALGHQVVAATSGKRLMALLGNHRPEIIVSDYRLADGLSGFEAIAAVRATFGEELPALLITGDTDPKLLRSMANRGIIVQHKPLEIEALHLCILGLTQPNH